MPEPKLVLEPSDLGVQPFTVGRYILHRQIARGGMATIHIARLVGDEGFSRIVAAKRLHPEFAEDAEFVAMFLDEARIASKVQHRNVVPVLDVVTAGDEVILVQEYVHGAPLQWLLRSTQQGRAQLPVNIAVSIACQVLNGLHATHETVDELGQPMMIVHRDVSPQNVMIAMDGTARLLDFGVAKAVMAAHVTREGTYKGKLAYSAPEQLRGLATHQSDVYSLSVLLWELLVGQRMHRSKSGAELVDTVLNGSPITIREALSAENLWDSISSADRRQLQVLDPIVRKGLAVDTSERWATAAEMEDALSEAARPATPSAVAAWLKTAGRDFIERRDGLIAAEEASFRKVNPVGSGRSLPAPLNSSINQRLPGSSISINARELASSEFYTRSHPRVLIAVLCTMIAMLTLGVIFLSRDPATERKVEAAAPARVSIPPATVAAPAAVVPSLRAQDFEATRPSAPAVLPPEQPAPAPEPQRAEEKVRAVRYSAPEVKDKFVRRTRSVAVRPPEPEPLPQSDTDGQAPLLKAANDCSTPYYFQGSKKLFKPACL